MLHKKLFNSKFMQACYPYFVLHSDLSWWMNMWIICILAQGNSSVKLFKGTSLPMVLFTKLHRTSCGGKRTQQNAMPLCVKTAGLRNHRRRMDAGGAVGCECVWTPVSFYRGNDDQSKKERGRKRGRETEYKSHRGIITEAQRRWREM